MKEFFKSEGRRYAQLNNQEWGWLIGMVMGLALGMYVALEADMQYVDWELMGPIYIESPIFKLIVRAAVTPVSGGFFATVFSHLGSGFDVITKKNTALSWIYKKSIERGGERQHLLGGGSQSSGDTFFQSTVTAKESSDYDNSSKPLKIHGVPRSGNGA